MTVGPAHKHEPATFTPSFQLFQGCLLFKAHYDGCDIYIHLSLSFSKTPNSPSRNTRQTSTPIPINLVRDFARFLLQFYLTAFFVRRTTCRLEIGFHWIHRALGEILENLGHLLFLLLYLLAKPGLDWIGRLQHGHGHSGFLTDFS